jgi:hypothetical protein
MVNERPDIPYPQHSHQHSGYDRYVLSHHIHHSRNHAGYDPVALIISFCWKPG